MLNVLMTLYICTNAHMNNCETFLIDRFEGAVAMSDCSGELPRRQSIARHIYAAGAHNVMLSCHIQGPDSEGPDA